MKLPISSDERRNMAIAVADQALATGLDRQTFRRIMVASSIGNILEWYDFFL